MAILDIGGVPSDVFNALNVHQQRRLRGGGLIPINMGYYDAHRNRGTLGTLQPSLIGAGNVARGNLPQTPDPTVRTQSMIGAGSVPIPPPSSTTSLLGVGPVPISQVNQMPEGNLGAPSTPPMVPSFVGAPSGTRVSPEAIASLSADRQPFAPGMDVSRPGRISSVGGGNVAKSLGKMAEAFLGNLGL